MIYGVFNGARNGGESRKVGELWPVVAFEMEAYPEPKILSRATLQTLMKHFKSTVKLANYIGASQAFVWEKIKKRRDSDRE